MATSFNMGIDWRRKGVICWEARPGDALNLLPSPLLIDGFYRWVFDGTGSGGVSTVVPAVSEQGIRAFRVTSPNAGGRLALVVDITLLKMGQPPRRRCAPGFLPRAPR